MQRFKRILLITGISVLLIGLVIGSVSLFGSYSSGTRVGKIVKFSKKGVVFKTYEGQLNVGGFAKDDEGDISPNVWSFSVHRGNDAVIGAIDRAMDQGYGVKLFYKEMFFQFGWRGDTKYFITQIERVEESP